LKTKIEPYYTKPEDMEEYTKAQLLLTNGISAEKLQTISVDYTEPCDSSDQYYYDEYKDLEESEFESWIQELDLEHDTIQDNILYTLQMKDDTDEVRHGMHPCSYPCSFWVL